MILGEYKISMPSNFNTVKILKAENEEEDGTKKAGDNEDTEMIEERLKDSVNLKEEENSVSLEYKR